MTRLLSQIKQLLAGDRRLQSILARSTSALSALQVMQILKPAYATIGSPRRASEELVVANVLHFAIAAEGKLGT